MSAARRQRRHMDKREPSTAADPAERFSADVGAAMERWGTTGATLAQVRDSLLRYAAQCHLMGEAPNDEASFVLRAIDANTKETRLVATNAKRGGSA